MQDKRHRVQPEDNFHRRSIRLMQYDYSSAGAYFVTICTKDRQPLFGEIIEGEMILNDMGKIVEEEVNKTETIRAQITIDKYVIMPNHVHIIVVISNVGANGGSPGIINIKHERACGGPPLPKSSFIG